MSDLSQKKCVPCEIGTPALAEDEVDEFLNELDGWEVSPDYKKINKNYIQDDFKTAVEFINRLADLAEKEGHHPDILLHAWNKVKVTLWTHNIGGLSENDFIMAAKIDQL